MLQIKTEMSDNNPSFRGGAQDSIKIKYHIYNSEIRIFEETLKYM